MGVYFGDTEITGLYFGDTEITGLYFGDTEIWAAWAEYDGTLPAQYTANGSTLVDYRIYGVAAGVGDRTENLFDKSLVTPNSLINDTTGEISNYPYYDTTGMMEIESNFVITFVKNVSGYSQSIRVGFYDVQNNFISIYQSSDASSPLNITVPSGTKKVRISYSNGKYAGSSYPDNLFIGLTVPISYEPYGYEVDMSVSDGTTSTTTPIYIGSDPLGEDEYVDYGEQKVYRRTEQLFNAETAVYKNGVFKNDIGVESTYPGAGYYETYIPITPSETIHVINVYGTENLTIRSYFYDAQKQWISRTIGYVGAFSVVTPSNAAYVQLQISPGFIPSPNTITITQGSTAPSSHIPYLQPEDPPIPLPALPTIDGTNIVDYAGQSAAPSRFYAKYKKG